MPCHALLPLCAALYPLQLPFCHATMPSTYPFTHLLNIQPLPTGMAFYTPACHTFCAFLHRHTPPTLHTALHCAHLKHHDVCMLLYTSFTVCGSGTGQFRWTGTNREVGGLEKLFVGPGGPVRRTWHIVPAAWVRLQTTGIQTPHRRALAAARRARCELIYARALPLRAFAAPRSAAALRARRAFLTQRLPLRWPSCYLQQRSILLTIPTLQRRTILELQFKRRQTDNSLRAFRVNMPVIRVPARLRALLCTLPAACFASARRLPPLYLPTAQHMAHNNL